MLQYSLSWIWLRPVCVTSLNALPGRYDMESDGPSEAVGSTAPVCPTWSICDGNKSIAKLMTELRTVSSPEIKNCIRSRMLVQF